MTGGDVELPVTVAGRPIIQATASGRSDVGDATSSRVVGIERLARWDEVLRTSETHLPSEQGLRSRRGGNHE